MAPLAGSGSLAIYITNLCQALLRGGHLVEVILPKYASLDLSAMESLYELEGDFYSYFGGDWYRNKIWTGTLSGVAVTLIDPLHPAGFFSQEHFYDYENDFERFTYFCRASLELLVKLGKQADILHLHNWQTAAVAPLFWEIFVHQGLGNTRLLFTCHDFKYQCLQEPHKLALCGLDPGKLNRPDRLQDNFEPHLTNLLKGGVVYSNKVTTVSPIYAADLLTREHGYGLDLTLNDHQHKFLGILNGLDESLWNPSQDAALPATYTVENLLGKSICKTALQQRLGLPPADYSLPLVGCIGFEMSELELKLMRAALECTLGKSAQFVFVGRSKIPRIRAILEDMMQNPKDENAQVVINYDDALVHQVVAASDILICPAIFEQTGQLPLIGMRYGTVPVAREVQGITGSIIDVDDVRRDMSQATGFSFSTDKATDLTAALSRALDCLKHNHQAWTALIRNCMTKDWSWDANCVEAYEAAYQSILNV